METSFKKLADPQILTPCGSGRRTDGDARSPEFEFWMVRNPSFPQQKLLSADELFSNGVLLPLHKLCISDDQPPIDPHASLGGRIDPATGVLPLSSSKRWMNIFSRKGKNCPEISDNNAGDDMDNSREKKKHKRSGFSNSSNGVTAAVELYISNIWPFSRSRSAGNAGTQPRPTASNRKVSSAPCSRSNSTGESKSRKWPSSPGRQGGVHLGRSSPVWQVRRSSGVAAAGGRNQSRRGRMPTGVDGPKARILSLNVPTTCIGYRHYVKCKSEECNSGNLTAATTSVGGGGQCGEGVPVYGVRGSSSFNIRSLFTKKVC